MYETIQAEIADGGRAFIVCPFVADSTVKGFELMKAAISERDRLIDSGTHPPSFPAFTAYSAHVK